MTTAGWSAWWQPSSVTWRSRRSSRQERRAGPPGRRRQPNLAHDQRLNEPRPRQLRDQVGVIKREQGLQSFRRRMARISFGVCFAPDPPPSRWVDLTKLAESNGFDYAWLFDSHVLWQEVYPIFTLMAANTKTIKIGPCVTNPGTRDPTVTASALATLQEISGGRMVMGIGRGDSARRVLGQKPVSVERMEADCRLIRDLAAGREVSYDGVKIRLKWAEHELPIWVAGYGPKALRAAGRVADGVIIQLADPAIIKWCLQFVREGAQEVGRNFDDIEIQAAAPAYVAEDVEAAREQVRL